MRPLKGFCAVHPKAVCAAQLPLLRARWRSILLGAVFQYVHAMSTQLAHRMHRPMVEPLHDIGFDILPVRAAHPSSSNPRGLPACQCKPLWRTLAICLTMLQLQYAYSSHLPLTLVWSACSSSYYLHSQCPIILANPYSLVLRGCTSLLRPCEGHSHALQELGLENAWVSELIFTSLFVAFVLWTFSPFVFSRKRFYTTLLYSQLLSVLVGTASVLLAVVGVI